MNLTQQGYYFVKFLLHPPYTRYVYNEFLNYMYIGIYTYIYALGHNEKLYLSGSYDRKQLKNTAVSYRA